jgi:hypothetical protein
LVSGSCPFCRDARFGHCPLRYAFAFNECRTEWSG